MRISEEVTYGTRRAIYTISPLFELERNGNVISMTVSGSADGWYDRYYGYYIWSGDLDAGLGAQFDYQYQQFDRPLDVFLQETLTPGVMTSGYYVMNYGAFAVDFNVVIFDTAAVFVGTAGVDYVFGSSGNDWFAGGASDDGFEAGGGDDIINGGPGGDLIDGGDGIDTVSFAGSPGVEVHLGDPQLNRGDAAGDRYISIENIIGSRRADSLHGDGGSNQIDGKLGGDFLFGGAGDDVLGGGAGADALFGEDGDDILIGGSDGDILSGGRGSDTASYANANANVYASLTAAGIMSGDAAGDVLMSIENLVGSRFDDRLDGNGGANAIDGGKGDDVIRGNGGNDVLTGGLGMDHFVFATAPDAIANVDEIVDFSVSDDTIVLYSRAFAGLAKGDLAGAAFIIGDVATTSAQRIIYNDLTGELSLDSDGTGGLDSVLFATLSAGLAMTAADFSVV